MSERLLRFSRTIYRGEAIDQAAKDFSDHATFELSETDSHFVVRVVADPLRLRTVAGEFANYALGVSMNSTGEPPK